MNKHPIKCKAEFREPECFSNQSIQPPERYKPHICMRRGWWRVSPLNVKGGYYRARERWDAAHRYAFNMNELIHAKHERL